MEQTENTKRTRYGRIRKAAAEYEIRFTRDPHNKGAFWVSDFDEVRDAAGGDTWDMIALALNAGFMIGYRCAKRERKEGRCL